MLIFVNDENGRLELQPDQEVQQQTHLGTRILAPRPHDQSGSPEAKQTDHL